MSHDPLEVPISLKMLTTLQPKFGSIVICVFGDAYVINYFNQ